MAMQRSTETVSADSSSCLEKDYFSSKNVDDRVTKLEKKSNMNINDQNNPFSDHNTVQKIFSMTDDKEVSVSDAFSSHENSEPDYNKLNNGSMSSLNNFQSDKKASSFNQNTCEDNDDHCDHVAEDRKSAFEKYTDVNERCDGADDSDSDDTDDASGEGEDQPGGESIASGTSDDESTSSSSSHDTENFEGQSNATNSVKISTDGRKLSDYELMRLERIRRNSEYLAKLGLERPGAMAQQQQSKRERKNFEKTRFSHRSKSTVDYSEGKMGVTSLHCQSLPQNSVPKDVEKKHEEIEFTEKKRNSKRARNVKDRMERFIYIEFARIRSHKRHVLRQAEKSVKLAEKEVHFWQKLVEKAEKRDKKRAEHQIVENVVKETTSFISETITGGEHANICGLIKEAIDRRKVLLEAAERYDNELSVEEENREREAKRKEAEAQSKVLDIVCRFPKALKDAESFLNSVVLDRLPPDQLPSRRSKRKGDEGLKQTEKKRISLGRCVLTSVDRHWDPSTPPKLLDVDFFDEFAAATKDDFSSPQQNWKAKNVVGWISPQFSEIIDRTWLERDSQSNLWNLSTYVPQFGECILYYPTGHKEFLRLHPDSLSRRVRTDIQIPLWERALRLKEQLSANSFAVPDESLHINSEKWWNDDWLARVETDNAVYPILCRVERSYAEFPPDPETKSAMNAKFVREKTKNFLLSKKLKRTSLRLTLILRPLTPLMPSTRMFGFQAETLALPPTFSAVTFPSDSEPFIIPFAWAYSLNHSLHPGLVKDRRLMSETYLLSDFSNLSESSGFCRLDEILPSVNAVASAFEKADSQKDTLGQMMSTAPNGFPLEDLRIVIDTIRSYLKEKDELRKACTDGSLPVPDLYNVICCTLPIWHSVSVMRSVHDRKKLYFSPWDLVPNNGKVYKSPYELPYAPFIDDELRLQLSLKIESWAEDHPFADIFYYPVSDEEAPLYHCAVPTCVCIQKILNRLQSDVHTKRGYYNSIESMLMDIEDIFRNCLLYNRPDSLVVDSAIETVTGLKATVMCVANEHYKKLEEARKIDDGCRLVKQATNVAWPQRDEADSTRSCEPIIHTLRQPFKEALYRDWLEHYEPFDPNPTTMNKWVPQTGDRIIYSPSKHATFLSKHSRSFETYQCVLPFVDDPCNQNMSEPLTGVVLWSRACFPKARSSQSDHEHKGFETKSTILALGLNFEASGDKVIVIYYRPCLFRDDTFITDIDCVTCGLSCLDSFIQLHPDHVTGVKCSVLCKSVTSSIVKCLNLLKRRCIRGEPLATIDSKISKENLRNGYAASSTRIGSATLPSYEDFFKNISLKAESNVCTRNAVSRLRHSDLAINSLLVEAGFLPRWASTALDEQVEQISRHGQISPTPKLSIELILLRLKNGYYRQRAAVENDIVESYVSQVFLSFADVVGRRKLKISFKQIAYLLTTNTLLGEAVDQSDIAAIEDCANRLRKIRELHSIAFVSVTETNLVESVFGIAVPSSTKLEKNERLREKTSTHRARQFLGDILSAIEVDNSSHEFEPNNVLDKFVAPCKRVRIRCDGIIVSWARYFRDVEHKTARVNGKDLRVKIVCDGKMITGGDIDNTDHSNAAAAAAAIGELKEIDHEVESMHSRLFTPKRKLVNVNIVTGRSGKTVLGETRTQAIVSHPLSDFSLVRLLDTCITFAENIDYETNDALVRLLFSEVSQMHPCARCQLHGRSLYACRVKWAHSNKDFDWFSFYDVYGSIDKLLQSLNQIHESHDISPSSTIEPFSTVHTSLEAPKQDDEKKEESCDVSTYNDTTQCEKQIDQTVNVFDVAEEFSRMSQDAADQSKGSKLVRTKNCLKKAEFVYTLSNEILKEADAYAQAPVRLSKHFISERFPLDEEDDHFMYCIVCGFGGNLLCCDGCPNVVHSGCVQLQEVPEGDWFCEECIINRSCPQENRPQAILTCFSRLEFDDDKAERMNLLLDRLIALRPDRRRKSASDRQQTLESCSFTVVNDNEGIYMVEDRASSRGLNIDKSTQKTKTIESNNLLNVKRSRGRPRKRLLLEDEFINEEHLEKPAQNANKVSIMNGQAQESRLRKQQRENFSPFEIPDLDLSHTLVHQTNQRKPGRPRKNPIMHIELAQESEIVLTNLNSTITSAQGAKEISTCKENQLKRTRGNSSLEISATAVLDVEEPIKVDMRLAKEDVVADVELDE